jgi:DNA-binding beta-propeller fold protein YncE
MLTRSMSWPARLSPLLAACALAGCGSAAVGELPPAAEPPRSPPVTAPPAGRVLRVGTGPEGISADPQTGLVAVARRDPPSLAIVDAGTGRPQREVPLPGTARHLTTVPGQASVLVPVESADALLTIDLQSGRVRANVPVGRQPHDAAAAGGAHLVGEEGANTVSLVRGGVVARRVRVATQPGGLAALAAGSALAVVSVRERVLELYDAWTLRRVGRAPAGVGPTHVACLDAGPCYVTDTQGGALLVYQVRPTLELVRRLFLPGGPYGLALDARRGRLYVTLPARNELVQLPAHGRPHVLRRWPTVRQPQTVAVDATRGRVLVTGRDAGVIQILRP